MAEIGVGLVGFGLAGRVFLAPVIRAVRGLRLSAIVQRSGESAAAAYPGVRIVRSLDELLAMDDVRLVIVATPNPSHAPLARQALDAGRDVVVDKPFTTTVAEAEELAQIARRCGRLLTVFQNRRWDGDFLTVRSLLKQGSLGRLVRFESHFDRFRPTLRGAWREQPAPGSGILFDLAPHLIDQALVLFGPPRAVSADVRRERDGALVDDAFDIRLDYDGFRAVLVSTMLAAEAGPRFRLLGTGGAFVKYGLDPQEEKLSRGDLPGGDSWGAEPPEAWGTLVREEAGGATRTAIPTERGDYRRYYEDVRDAILTRRLPDVTLDQALTTMRLLELARESSTQRRSLPFTRSAANSGS